MSTSSARLGLLALLLAAGCGKAGADAFTLSASSLSVHRGEGLSLHIEAKGTTDPGAVKVTFPPGNALQPDGGVVFQKNSDSSVAADLLLETDPHAKPGDYALGIESPKGKMTVKVTLTGGSVNKTYRDFPPTTLSSTTAVLPDGTVASLEEATRGQVLSGLRGVRAVEPEAGLEALDLDGNVYSYTLDGTSFSAPVRLPGLSDIVQISLYNPTLDPWYSANPEVDKRFGPGAFLRKDGTVWALDWVDTPSGPQLAVQAIPGATNVVQLAAPYALQGNGDVLRYSWDQRRYVPVPLVSDAVFLSGTMSWFIRDDGLVMTLPVENKPWTFCDPARATHITDSGKAVALLTHFESRTINTNNHTVTNYIIYSLRDDGTVWDHSWYDESYTASNLPGAEGGTQGAPTNTPVGSFHHFVALAMAPAGFYGLTTDGKVYQVNTGGAEPTILPRIRLPSESAGFYAEANLDPPPPPLTPGGTTSIPVRIHHSEEFNQPITFTAKTLPAGVTMAPVTAPAGADSATLVLTAAAGLPPTVGDVQVEARADAMTQPLTLPIPAALSLRRTFALGAQTSFAVRQDGSVLAWGSNADGMMGGGTIGPNGTSFPPTAVPGLADIQQVAANQQALALDGQGQVWAWGANTYGETGQPLAYPPAIPTPARVAGLPPVVSVAALPYHSLALDAQGVVWFWGAGDPTPRVVPGLTGATYLAETGDALTASGYDVWDGANHAYTPYQATACPDGATLARLLAVTPLSQGVPGLLRWDGSLLQFSTNPMNSQLVCTPSSAHDLLWLGESAMVHVDGTVEVSAGATNTLVRAVATVAGATAAASDTSTDTTLVLAADGTLWGVGRNTAGRLADLADPVTTAAPITGVSQVRQP